MTDTLIVQSYRTHDVAPWLLTCMGSVRAWAAGQGHAYEFVDDALFDPLPDWYREKCGPHILPMTDLARLLLMHDRLAQGWRRVVWMDADMLVFDPERLRIDIRSDCAFCREIWVDRGPDGMPKASFLVNNSVTVMTAGSPMLPFMIHAALQIMCNTPAEKVDHIIVGTRFLTQLSQLMPIELLMQVGMVTPALGDELSRDGGDELARLFAAQSRQPIAAANLCASLSEREMAGVRLGSDGMARVVERLMASRGEVVNRHLVDAG